MGNIPSRSPSPYPGQFITLCFDQSWPFRAWSRTSQWKNTSCHPLFVHSPPFSFVVVRTLKRGYRRSKLVFFTKAPSSPWSHPHRLAHSGLLRPDSRLWDCPSSLWCRSHQRNGSSIALQSVSSPYCQPPCLAASCLTALQSVSSPYSQPPRLAASCLTALQSVSSPYSQPPRLTVSPLALLPAVSQPCSRLVALQSVSSPCCQPPRLAVGRLEICLTALQSAPSPCSRPRHLAVGPITLQLLILSLITRHSSGLLVRIGDRTQWSGSGAKIFQAQKVTWF